MTTFICLYLLIATCGLSSAQKQYQQSSRVTHSQVGKQVREDSRVYYIPDDQPKRPSKNRKVHPPALKREPTPIPSAPPMYRQESTVGFSGEDWRARHTPVVIHGGGGDYSLEPAQVQNIDVGIRGIARIEGKRGRECCDRPEGQRWPNWVACFFACCGGRR